MTKLYKWQLKFVEKVYNMTNRELLDATIDLAAGDDYDGSFMPRSEWKYERLRDALYGRLGAWLGPATGLISVTSTPAEGE